MLRKILFFALIMLVTNAFSQPDLTSGIPMQYHYYLAEVDEGEQPQYVYEPGGAALFSPFFVPELKAYSGTFLTYIQNMRSVVNHVGPLGTLPPESLGAYHPVKALRMIDKGILQPVGRMYFNDRYKQQVTYREERIYIDDKEVYYDGLLIKPKDSVYTEDLITGQMKLQVVEGNTDFYDEAIGAGFIEEWEYDKNKARFEKDIEYLQLMLPKFDAVYGDYRGMQTLFTFKTGDFKKRSLGEAIMVKRDVESYVLFNLGFSSAEDPMISAELVKNAIGNGYIEPSERYELLLHIFQSVKEGQAAVYHYNPVDFKLNKAKKATPDAFFGALSAVDTVQTEDLHTGKMVNTVVSHEASMQDIVGIRFFEDWYMDEDNFSLYKRVKGIVLLKEARDTDTGLVKGVTPYTPFYIQLNPRL